MRQSTVFLCLAFLACTDTTNTPKDMSVAKGDMTSLSSQCGHPGDRGNSKGVGRFCTTQQECADIPNGVCSHLFRPEVYFCTITPCTSGIDTATCGENTLCQCETAGCGCTPTACGTGDGGT